MATQQLQIGFEEAVGWIVAGPEAGPAGAVSLDFDRLRVTVDAAAPETLVELAVFADSRGAALPAAALDVIRRLLGDAVAGALAARPAAPVTVAVEAGRPTVLMTQVARAAHAEFLRRHDTVTPRLASWRLLSALGPLRDIAGAGELLAEAAWDTLPAAIALGRSAARHAEAVGQLSRPHRADLAAALATLRQVLEDHHWDGSGEGPLADLATLLAAEPSDIDQEWLTVSEPGEENTDAGEHGADALRGFAGAGGRPVELRRLVVPLAELRSRLGDFAAEAFAGALVDGEVPGRIRVEMPLCLGAEEVAPDLVVRVHTWSGHLLGQGAMRITTPPRSLPLAQGRVTVQPPPVQPPLRVTDIHVDIALAGLPPLDAAGLRREARILARRAGINAMLARHAGNWGREAAAWSRSARLYRVGGDETRAATAADQAGDATERSYKGRLTDRDWASELSHHWPRVADQEITDALGAPLAERIDQLQRVVRDVSAGASGSRQLARACRELSAALRAADGGDNETAGSLLREALRVHCLLADPGGADAVVSELAAVEPADASGAAQDGHDD